MEFTKAELEFIKGMVDAKFDEMYHHEDDYTDGEWDVFTGIRAQFEDAFRAAGFWWAK